MVTKDILKYLEKKKIDYRLIKHKEVYTADKIAKACKVPEKSVLKGLFLKATGGKFVLAVLPANMAVKITRIKKALELKKLEMSNEKDMKVKTGFKPGSAPFLGKLLKVVIVADKLLEKSKNIVFPAGDYKTSIEINSLDWFKLEEPEVLDFAVKPSGKRKVKKRPKPNQPKAGRKIVKKKKINIPKAGKKVKKKVITKKTVKKVFKKIVKKVAKKTVAKKS